MLSNEFLEDVFQTFGAYLAMEELQAVVEATLYEAIRASISGATREQALEYARERALELATGISEQMRTQLAEVIAKGLEEQLGVPGTAELLRGEIGLDAARAARLEKFRESLASEGLSAAETEARVNAYREQLINERAETIAQYEMGCAMEAGNYAAAQERGATHKVWITVGAGNVCEICEENQAAGPIPINEAFPSGEEYPEVHPNCHCTVAYVTDTGAGEVEDAAERAQERADRLAAIKGASPEEEE